MLLHRIHEIFGDQIPQVTFNGGSAVSILCRSLGFHFLRGTNDFDVIAKDMTSEIAINKRLCSLEGCEPDPRNRVNNIKHYRLGDDFVDLLDNRVLHLPTITVTANEQDYNIANPADIAGVKIARFVTSYIEGPEDLRTHDILDTSILNVLMKRHSEPDKYEEFLRNTCLNFVITTRISDIDFDEALNGISDLKNKRQYLESLIPTDDPNSPLFHFKEPAIKNTVQAFLEFIDELEKEARSNPVYEELSNIINKRDASPHKREEMFLETLPESFFPPSEAKEFTSRAFNDPQAISFTTYQEF